MLPEVWGASQIDLDKTFYLSGPMAGYPDHNFAAFKKAAGELRDAGIKIISPAEIEVPFDRSTATDADYLANDFGAMCAYCQGIILLRGWPLSTGARAELEIALTLKWPVYYYENFTITNMNKEGVL